MKSHELVEKINNGEIKDGTKFMIYLNGNETERIVFDEGKSCLKYEATKDILDCSMLLSNDLEFEIVEEYKGWFEPKEGEKFFWVTYDRQHIIEGKWNAKSDSNSYKNNRFRTRAEAQEYLDYKNALKEAEKPFEPEKHNHFFYYSIYDKEIKLYDELRTINQGTTYLGTDAIVARAFIDEWHDEILKYEFGIWE